MTDSLEMSPERMIEALNNEIRLRDTEIKRLHQTISELRGVIAASRRRQEISNALIVELGDFLQIANEQTVALKNENGELRGIIQQAADDVVAASYPRTMHLEWLEAARKAARKALAEDDHIASADCWCKPTESEDGIFVHHSMDRREKHEEGGKLQ